MKPVFVLPIFLLVTGGCTSIVMRNRRGRLPRAQHEHAARVGGHRNPFGNGVLFWLPP